MAKKKEPKTIIGRHVKYFDYLDAEHYGTIVAIEPYPIDPAQVYVYIEDEESEFNIHEDEINGQMIKYAEVRPSAEVYMDE